MTQRYLPLVDLACAGSAALVWYLALPVGGWPLLLGLLPFALRLVLTGRLSVRSAFDKWLLLFLVTAAVAVWSAYDRDVAWEKFWLIVGAVLLFYAFANGMARYADLYLYGLAGLGVIVTLFFIATHDWEQFPTKIAFLEQIGRALQAPLPTLDVYRIHPNVIGGLLLFALPFGAATAKSHRAVGIAATAIILFGLLLSMSRGAWIGAVVLGGVALFWSISERSARLKPIRPHLFISLTALALLLWVLLLVTAPASLQRVMQLIGGASRTELWRDGYLLAGDYPLIGAGLGNFTMLHASYALLTHVGFIVHAHNIFLDLSIEQGLLAVVALVGMWSSFGRVVFADRQRPNRALTAAGLSVIGIAVHGLFDDALYGSGGLVFLFIPLAFAVQDGATRPSRVAWRRLAIPAGIAVIAFLFTWRMVAGVAVANWAAVRQSQTELAVYSWPEWEIQDAVRRSAELAQIVQGYQRSLTLYPNHAAANRRLGQVELSLGEYGDALDHLQQAHEVQGWADTVRQLYGEALLASGQVDEGDAMWKTVRQEQAQLQLRAFWYSQLDDVSLKQRITDASR